jgi:anti-sigma factor RsiW
MNCKTYQDLVAVHVDGMLDALEKREAEQHLAICPQCRRLFAEESRFYTAFVAQQLIVPVPGEVEARLRAALSAAVTPTLSWRTRLFASLSQPRLAFGLIAAVLVLALLLPRLFSRAQQPAWFHQAVDAYHATTEGHPLFTYQTDNPQELEKAFNSSGQLDFVTHVLDLQPAGYRIVGGYILHDQGHPVAVILYRGKEGSIVCLRQRGMSPPMPAGSKGEKGQYLYTQAGYTFSFAQFADHFCTLITRLPLEVFQQQLRTATAG